jgi:hypothetical protein
VNLTGAFLVAFALSMATHQGAGAASDPNPESETGAPEQLEFRRGENHITIERTLTGQRDLYFINARPGQRLTIDVSNRDHKAFFQVYDYRTRWHVYDGVYDFQGRAMPKGDEDYSTTHWSIKLENPDFRDVFGDPVSGTASRYGNSKEAVTWLVVVGAEQPNARYELAIKIE